MHGSRVGRKSRRDKGPVQARQGQRWLGRSEVLEDKVWDSHGAAQ